MLIWACNNNGKQIPKRASKPFKKVSHAIIWLWCQCWWGQRASRLAKRDPFRFVEENDERIWEKVKGIGDVGELELEARFREKAEPWVLVWVSVSEREKGVLIVMHVQLGRGFTFPTRTQGACVPTLIRFIINLHQIWNFCLVDTNLSFTHNTKVYMYLKCNLIFFYFSFWICNFFYFNPVCLFYFMFLKYFK